MIHGDSVESTAVSCVMLGSHTGHVYRPANSADQHLKRPARDEAQRRSFKFGLPNPLDKNLFLPSILILQRAFFSNKEILGSYILYKLVKGTTECE